MYVSKKFAAIAASLAVMAPVGIAQATHESGQAGAPGQICKPLLKAQKEQMRAFRNQTPTPSNAEVKAFRKAQKAAYKGCIQGAADARSHEEPPAGS